VASPREKTKQGRVVLSAASNNYIGVVLARTVAIIDDRAQGSKRGRDDQARVNDRETTAEPALELNPRTRSTL
jgi:hypothetical protein